MPKTASAWTFGITVVIAAAAMVACSDDPASKIGARHTGPGGSGASSGNPNDPNNPGSGDPIADDAQAKFLALQPDFEKKCGGPCHTQGTYRPEPPEFVYGRFAHGEPVVVQVRQPLSDLGRVRLHRRPDDRPAECSPEARA